MKIVGKKQRKKVRGAGVGERGGEKEKHIFNF